MSHDLDSALRDSLRRHAESAPTIVDTDGVRLRAKKIQRRRMAESATAAFAALVVAGGIAFGVSSLSTDATPPPVTTVTPAPNPGNLAPLAFSNGDGNNPDRLLVRVAGTDVEIPNPAPGRFVAFVGWYGPDHRTLVMSARLQGLREAVLYAVTLGPDNRPTGSPQELEVPGLPKLGAGDVFAVRDGPLQLWVPLAPGNPASPATLVTIAPDLGGGTTRPMPTGLTAIAVTADHALLLAPGTTRLSVASLTSTGTPSTEPVTACTSLTAAESSLDGTKVALGCGDGTVDVITLADQTVSHLAAVPEVTPDGGLLNLWWDPSAGLHASTTPIARADYTEVHSWDWVGRSWVRGLDGMLTRTYPVDAPSARFMKENAAPGNIGRWIVESAPEVDLGPAGDTLAVAPAAQATPTPTPTPTANALPPAPTSPPWSAVTRDYQPANGPPLVGVMVNIGGRTRQVGEGANAQTEIAGWSGTGRRTLVWGFTQDYPGDQGIRTASFNADGALASGPTDLAIPTDRRVIGRPFVLGDGRLVVWRIGAATATAVQGKLLRFTADLSDASVTDLPPGDPVFATSKYVGLQPDSTTLLVVGARGSGTRTLPDCPGYSATASADEEFVAISCGGSTIEVLDLPTVSGDSGAAGGVTRLPVFPDGSKVLSTWFDPAGQLFASSKDASGAIRTWVWGTDTSGQWGRASQQGVVDRGFPGDGYAVALYADPSALLPDAKPYTWLTETDPALDLAVVGTRPGDIQSIAVRPPG